VKRRYLRAGNDAQGRAEALSVAARRRDGGLEVLRRAVPFKRRKGGFAICVFLQFPVNIY